ncbi:hypothetical protein EXS72_00585 [Candidatus Pacearchaeota archaeon]|nr:hypothetical protein [Candidatus Pacearchaeota archaeon]
MKNKKTILTIWKEIFSKPRYLILTIVTALIMYIVTIISSDYLELKIVLKQKSINLIWNFFIGFPTTIKWYSTIALFLICILFGLFVSLNKYKSRQVTNQKGSIIGTIGLFLGMVAPGCVTCGIGLTSVLGIAGILIYLPFKGFEVSILSIVLLIWANLKVSKSLLMPNICSIK